MNLLIGVAVGDIEAIKNQAEIRLLTNQVCDMTSLPINNQLFYKTHTTHTIFEDNLYTHIPNFKIQSLVMMLRMSCSILDKEFGINHKSD